MWMWATGTNRSDDGCSKQRVWIWDQHAVRQCHRTYAQNALGDIMITVWQRGADGVRHALCGTVTYRSMIDVIDPTALLVDAERNIVRCLFASALIRAGADPESIGIKLSAGTRQSVEIDTLPPGFESRDHPRGWAGTERRATRGPR